MDPNEKLCIHYPRSPYFNPPVDPEDFLQEARDNCFCDNCFYGRDAMALEIIRLRKMLDAALDDNWEDIELTAYRVARSGWTPN